MTSTVYACTMRASTKESLLKKLDRLAVTAGLERGIKPRDLVAIKLHFGEKGNTAFIRPIYVRRIVEAVTALKAHPFLTDTNTLYVGTRCNSAQHQITAVENGFAYSVVGAPLIIADGLKGTAQVEIPIPPDGKDLAYVATDIYEADVLISLAHFKLHELCGFGGALKNVGMGCASRRGKMAQHSGISPKVVAKKCIGCGDCTQHCAQLAISLTSQNDHKEKAYINSDKCIGCAECILVCPQNAIQIQWGAVTIPQFMKKMVDYTAAALKNKGGKAFFFNFLTQISPACDCYGHADAPLVRDIGILASTDIVAVDQASIDLVNQEPGLPGTSLTTAMAPGEDKVKGIYPSIDWTIQLDYAQQIGLGSRDYRLEWLSEK